MMFKFFRVTDSGIETVSISDEKKFLKAIESDDACFLEFQQALIFKITQLSKRISELEK